MDEIEKGLYEKAEASIKEMLENCGYEGEMRKVFKEGAKAGAKLMQELLQEAYKHIILDAEYGDIWEEWKKENLCEN